MRPDRFRLGCRSRGTSPRRSGFQAPILSRGRRPAPCTAGARSCTLAARQTNSGARSGGKGHHRAVETAQSISRDRKPSIGLVHLRAFGSMVVSSLTPNTSGSSPHCNRGAGQAATWDHGRDAIAVSMCFRHFLCENVARSHFERVCQAAGRSAAELNRSHRRRWLVRRIRKMSGGDSRLIMDLKPVA